MRIEALHNNDMIQSSMQDFALRHGLLFHTHAWLSNYNRGNLIQCAILNNNSEIIGCFLHYVFNKAFFRLVISPPFTPHIALYYQNPAQSVVGKQTFDKEVMTALSAYFKNLGADYLNLNLPLETVDTQPFTWDGFVVRPRYTYLVDLKRSGEDLWNNLASEKRKSINKALKDEVTVEETNNPDLLYPLILQSLQRNGKAKNDNIIRKILYSFATPANSIAFVAWYQKIPVSASFCVLEGDRAVYLFGGYSGEAGHHGAGVSCLWKSILKAKELGLEYFDFEGSMNVSIERYFREFGGELRSYHCIEKTRPLLGLLLRLRKQKLV